LIRHIRVFEKTSVPPADSLQQGDVDELLDRQIASLRQLVEHETQSRAAHGPTAAARSSRALGLVIANCARAARSIAFGTQRLPLGVADGLRQAGWSVSRRRLEVVFYGLCILMGVAVGWLISGGAP
jgi:hypothetical protein